MLSRSVRSTCVFTIFVILSFSLAAFPQSETINKVKSCTDTGMTYFHNVKPETKQSKLTLGISPVVFIPDDRSSNRTYSLGYGFDLNCSYKLSEDINISGAIGVIVSKAKFDDMIGMRYDTTNAYRVSASLGPQFFINKGSTRIYFDINLLYLKTYFQDSYVAGYIIKNSYNMLGFGAGFGLEIPVYKKLNAKIIPSYNYVFPIEDEPIINKSGTFYKISAGLSYKL